MALIDNIIAAWKLDGNGNDSHGSYHLTASGSINWATAMGGQGVSFPASGTNYLYSTAVPPPGTSPFSISLWAKWNTAPTSTQQIFVMTASGERRFFQLEYDSNCGMHYEFAFNLNASGTGIGNNGVEFCTGAPPTTWTHFVLVVDLNGGKTRLTAYRNGALVNSITHSTYNYSFPQNAIYCGFFLGAFQFYVNSCNSGLMRPMNDGIVDEVYYWHRALTSAEVSELYNNGAGKFYPFTGGGGGAPLGTRRLLTM